MNPQIWSWLLMAVGVTGLWLAGKRSWTGWAVGLAGQGLWLAYAIATRQWGFLASCFVYGAVYLRNLRAWLRPTPTTQTPATPPAPAHVERNLPPAAPRPRRQHTGPARCLTPYCLLRATHWHDGAPRCLPCAHACIREEGLTGVEPVPGSDSDFAAYYLTRDMNPALRTDGAR